MGICDSTPTQKQQARQDMRQSQQVQQRGYGTYPKGEVRYVDRKVQESFKGTVEGGKSRVNLKFGIKNLGNFNLNEISIESSITSAMMNGNMSSLGRTEREVVQANCFTNFGTSFELDYFFERHQNLKITVYSGNNVLGSVNTTLGAVTGAKNQAKEFPINENVLIATVKIIEEESANNLINFKIDFAANNASNYFVIVNSMFAGPQKVVKSAEVCGNKVTFVINDLKVFDVNANKREQEFQIDFYEEKFSTLLFSLKTSLEKLSGGNQFLFDPSINSFVPNNNGNVTVNYSINKVMRFLEYLEKGLQISVVCGIDYTGSNGIYTSPNSKHHIHGQEPNQYEQAIRMCGGIVSYYDYDQFFPVLGFGGMLPGNPLTNHCFNVSLSDNPNVQGVDGIIDTYKRSLEVVRLDGPTLFSPLIRSVTRTVAGNVGNDDTCIYNSF